MKYSKEQIIQINEVLVRNGQEPIPMSLVGATCADSGSRFGRHSASYDEPKSWEQNTTPDWVLKRSR